MIIVTGGAGFIGSNLILGLNEAGHKDILLVDDLNKQKKNNILSSAVVDDQMDLNDFRSHIVEDKKFPKKVKAVFHQGACSTTTEWDSRYMMDNNYNYSKTLLHYCIDKDIPFIYASSAAVYGTNTRFEEEGGYESPINVYGYSKYIFDEYVRKMSKKIKSQVVGLRYFNVYGPGEDHKGKMASTAFHFNNQLKSMGEVKLFKGSDGFNDGEQRRDFIYVEDVVNINIWFFENANISGIFNVGTGNSRSFNDMANSIVDWHGHGRITYIKFPELLVNSYQSYTEANIVKLRKAGYKKDFNTLEEGINKYLSQLNPVNS